MNVLVVDDDKEIVEGIGLFLMGEGFDVLKAYNGLEALELLNEKDEILDEIYTTESEFDFNFLKTGNYYFKILVDENANEFWDAGDFFTKKQAEKSFIYPEMINVRALWDMNETWILTTPEIPTLPTDENEKSPSETEEDSH